VEKSMLSEINRLRKMTAAELVVEWERVFGAPPRATNRQHMWRKLAWEIQAGAHGGLSDATRTRLDELGTEAFTRAASRHQRAHDAEPAAAVEPASKVTPIRNRRLPAPGSVIVREHRGRELRLVVLENGFELDGIVHASLSEAARAATGSRWNGWLFWGLAERTRRR